MEKSRINSNAIRSIRPDDDFSIGDTYATLTWYDWNKEVKPTEQEFDDAVTAWQAEYDAQEYARNRQAEYPSVGDQLDMLMKDMKNGTKTHQTACEAVKKKYKKP